MRRSFWLGFAAYIIPSFPLGYCWHLVTFADQYHALDIYRDQVIIPMGLASMIVQACFFSWAYPKLFSTQNADWIKSALASAVVFALLSWSFTTLPVAAKYQMTSVADFMMLETAFTILQFSVIAPLIALAHRQKQ